MRKIANLLYPVGVVFLESAVNLDHVVSLANKLKDIDFCELSKRLLKVVLCWKGIVNLKIIRKPIFSDIFARFRGKCCLSGKCCVSGSCCYTNKDSK